MKQSRIFIISILNVTIIMCSLCMQDNLNETDSTVQIEELVKKQKAAQEELNQFFADRRCSLSKIFPEDALKIERYMQDTWEIFELILKARSKGLEPSSG